MDLFKKKCPQIKEIQNLDIFLKEQILPSKVNIKQQFTINTKSKNQFYLQSIYHYVASKEKKYKFFLSLKDAILKSEVSISSNQDFNSQELDYIHKSLYKISDLNIYYTLAKENNFELGLKIAEWLKKMMKLIHNK